MYESRKHPPLPRIYFFRRLALHVAGAMGLLLGSLLIGIAAYAYFEDLAWRDAFLNSAMLLGGMGPVDAPEADGGKVFAGSMHCTQAWSSSSPPASCSYPCCTACWTSFTGTKTGSSAARTRTRVGNQHGSGRYILPISNRMSRITSTSPRPPVGP